ncbi:MAG: hypothetical protein GYA50_05135 [Eubacteriaceae bacterium]|nr:hypothetical protein [Eubacteriaceae bacterium]
MIINKKNDSGEDKPFYGKVDERTKAVVYKADSYTARFMMFAVLIDVFARGLNIDISFFNSNWDLMLIVICNAPLCQDTISGLTSNFLS